MAKTFYDHRAHEFDMAFVTKEMVQALLVDANEATIGAFQFAISKNKTRLVNEFKADLDLLNVDTNPNND